MKNWASMDRDQLLVLPPSVDDLLPQDHLARFVVDAVDSLDLSALLARYDARARGSNPYHPAMMLSLLFYGYTTGTMSSRKIERACQYDLAFRFIACGHAPDHGTIAEFRKRHLADIPALFVQLLALARELGLVKVGTVAIDGTKVKANASKHAAASYRRAKEIEAELRREVERLMRLAEQADNEPLAEGLDIPAEIARREARIAQLQEARRAIEQRHAEELLEQRREELEANLEETRKALAEGRTPPDPPPPPVPAPPPDNMQSNHTDRDSRIMPDKGTFSQAYNAQAAVDTATMLIVGHHLSQKTNDKRELLPAIAAIAESYGTPTEVLADAGYFSARNIARCPVDAYIAPGKTRHRRSLDERLRKPAGGTAPADATAAEAMRHKLDTERGRALYRLRKMTVEPAFGILKSAMGLRQFLLRGAEKVAGEWALACLAYNLRRMWTLQAA